MRHVTKDFDRDRNTIVDAAGQIETKETVEELEKAEAATSEDIEFLQNEIDKAEEAREESENLQSRHRDRVHGSRR